MSEDREFSAKGSFEVTKVQNRPTPVETPENALLKAAKDNFDFARQYLDKYLYWPDYILATHYRAFAMALLDESDARENFQKVDDWLNERTETGLATTDEPIPDVARSRLRLRYEAHYNSAFLAALHSLRHLIQKKNPPKQEDKEWVEPASARIIFERLNDALDQLDELSWSRSAKTPADGVKRHAPRGVQLAAEFSWLRFFAATWHIPSRRRPVRLSALVTPAEWTERCRTFRAYLDALQRELSQRAKRFEGTVLELEAPLKSDYFPVKIFETSDQPPLTALSEPQQLRNVLRAAYRELKSWEDSTRASDTVRRSEGNIDEERRFVRILQTLPERLSISQTNRKTGRVPRLALYFQTNRKLTEIRRTISELQSIVTKTRKDAAILIRMGRTLDRIESPTGGDRVVSGAG